MSGPASRLDRRCRSAVLLTAGAGWAASGAALSRLDPAAAPWLAPGFVLLTVSLVVLPLLRRRLVAAAERVPGLRHLFPGAADALQVAPLVLLALREPSMLVPAALALLEGRLVARAGRDAAAGAALVVGVVQVLVAAQFGGGPETGPLLLVAVAAGTVGAALVHGRAAMRRAAGRLDPPWAADEEPGLGRRASSALPAALLVLAVALLVHGTIPERFGAASPLPDLPDEPEDPRRRPARPPGTAAGTDRPAPPLGEDANELLAGLGGTPPLGDYVVMTVEPRTGGRPRPPRRPLLLRYVLLDQIAPHATQLSDLTAPPVHRDADDGVVDGWARFGVPPPGRGLLDLEIRQRSVSLPPHGWELLPTSGDCHAVAAETAHYDPDRLLAVEGLGGGWVTARLLCAELRPTRAELSAARAVTPDPRWVALPPDPRLAGLLSKAREATQGASTDLEAVEGVVRHFADYEYNVETLGLAGLDAALAVLNGRRGHCTDVATTAALLLRLNDVPARVALGYRCESWDPGRAAYTVRASDGHAWIEVHFQGVGWVPFDPTPPDARRRALDAWYGVAEPSPWERLMALFAWIPPVPAYVLVLVLSILAAAAAAAVSRVRAARARGQTDSGARLVTARGTALDYAHLLRLLARLGHVKRPHQTPREFANGVARADADLAPLVPVTELFYASRFGGRVPTEDEMAAVRTFVASLNR